MKRNRYNHIMKWIGRDICMMAAMGFIFTAKAQNNTFPAGSIIIDMGIVIVTTILFTASSFNKFVVNSFSSWNSDKQNATNTSFIGKCHSTSLSLSI